MQCLNGAEILYVSKSACGRHCFGIEIVNCVGSGVICPSLMNEIRENYQELMIENVQQRILSPKLASSEGRQPIGCDHNYFPYPRTESKSGIHSKAIICKHYSIIPHSLV